MPLGCRASRSSPGGPEGHVLHPRGPQEVSAGARAWPGSDPGDGALRRGAPSAPGQPLGSGGPGPGGAGGGHRPLRCPAPARARCARPPGHGSGADAGRRGAGTTRGAARRDGPGPGIRPGRSSGPSDPGNADGTANRACGSGPCRRPAIALSGRTRACRAAPAPGPLPRRPRLAVLHRPRAIPSLLRQGPYRGSVGRRTPTARGHGDRGMVRRLDGDGPGGRPGRAASRSAGPRPAPAAVGPPGPADSPGLPPYRRTCATRSPPSKRSCGAENAGPSRRRQRQGTRRSCVCPTMSRPACRPSS